MSSLDRVLCRIYGSFVLLFAALQMIVRHANRYAASHGGHDLQFVWKSALFCLVLGVPMLFALRPAFLLFVWGVGSIGAAFFLGAALEASKTPWILLGLPFYAGFTVPFFLMLSESRKHGRLAPNGR